MGILGADVDSAQKWSMARKCAHNVVMRSKLSGHNILSYAFVACLATTTMAQPPSLEGCGGGGLNSAQAENCRYNDATYAHCGYGTIVQSNVTNGFVFQAGCYPCNLLVYPQFVCSLQRSDCNVSQFNTQANCEALDCCRWNSSNSTCEPNTCTYAPTMAPTATPTNAPTMSPTAVPTYAPTARPTAAPTAPTDSPTAAPTEATSTSGSGGTDKLDDTSIALIVVIPVVVLGGICAAIFWFKMKKNAPGGEDSASAKPNPAFSGL